MAWWNTETQRRNTSDNDRAVAYYRHSAQIGQENSVEIQQDNVRTFADKHGLMIIHEFADRGKSGLNAEGRPEFNEMMKWVQERNDFAHVLVLDVTRWGRFQDMDLSAHYESICTQNGKQVIYTNHGIPKEEDQLVNHLRKSLDRYQSAEYSRVLSKKVFEGCVKVATQGYRPGGAPPYAFYRMMLDERKQPDRILNPGQRKSLQNGRVVLVPGNEEHVKIVQEIFLLFVEKQYTERQIAGHLNAKQIPSPGGVLWRPEVVRGILTNQQYAGAVVYNKTSQRLKSPSRRNPEEHWIVTPNAFKPLVNPSLYEQARQIMESRKRRINPEQMLTRLRELYSEYGILTSKIVQIDPQCASPGSFSKCFGTMNGAFQSMFSNVVSRIKNEVFNAICEQVRIVDEYDNFLVVNGDFTVLIQPCMPMPSGYGEYWQFLPDQRPVVDITLGVPLSEADHPEILGYLALPRLLMPDKAIRLTYSSEGLIELQAYSGLEFIRKLVDRSI